MKTPPWFRRPLIAVAVAACTGEPSPAPADTVRADTDYGAIAWSITWMDHTVGEVGSPDSEVGRSADELLHAVSTLPYGISDHEVTQGEFVALMHYNPSAATACGEDCPVDNVSWHEAAAYLNALSEYDGAERCYTCAGERADVRCEPRAGLTDIRACAGFRLPSEAEWELAARGGVEGAFQGGGELRDADRDGYRCDPFTLSDGSQVADFAWYCANSEQKLHVYGLRTPNAAGLFDMSGNAAEWCQDWYGAYAPGAPQGPPTGDGRVVRGGRYASVPHQLRLAKREWLAPDQRAAGLGFRIARTASGANVPLCTYDVSRFDDGCLFGP